MWRYAMPAGRGMSEASGPRSVSEQDRGLIDRSEGRVRADVVHEKLTRMEFVGSERTARRAVATRSGGRRLIWCPRVRTCCPTTRVSLILKLRANGL